MFGTASALFDSNVGSDRSRRVRMWIKETREHHLVVSDASFLLVFEGTCVVVRSKAQYVKYSHPLSAVILGFVDPEILRNW